MRTNDFDDKNMPLVRTTFLLLNKPQLPSISIDEIDGLLMIPNGTIRRREEFPLVSQKRGLARDCWRLELTAEKCFDIACQMDEMMKFLSGKESIIRELHDKNDVEISFNISIHTCKEKGYPSMKMNNVLISFASSISAAVRIDDYRY